MFAEAWFLLHKTEQLLRKLQGLQRAEPQALDLRDAQHLPRGIRQRRDFVFPRSAPCHVRPLRFTLPPRFEILAIRPKVDARQHDLMKPCRCQFFRFPAHTVQRTRAHGPARVGNDAVRAEVFAALLDLQKGPGALRRSEKGNIFERFRIHDIGNAIHQGRLLPELLHIVHDPRPLLRPKHEPDALDGADFLVRHLRIAARDRYDRIPVHAVRTPYHLPRFPIAETCHGAGIHDVDVRRLGKRHDLIAALLEQPLHRLRFELVDLAAKCHESRLRHLYLPFPIILSPNPQARTARRSLPQRQQSRHAGCAAQASRSLRHAVGAAPPHPA